MLIEVPEDLERVLTARANLLGVSPIAYIQEVLRRGITVEEGTTPAALTPLKTGIHLGVPVISRDRRIRAASLSTIW